MRNNEIYDLVVKFRNLSDEGQKEFLKELVLKGYLNNYVDYEVSKFTPQAAPISTYEGVKQAYKERLEEKVEKTIDQTIEQLKSNDEELKCRLFSRFIDSYDQVVDEERKNICSGCHDFSRWEERLGERPRFNELGEIESFYCGTWYERRCFYCGTIEKAWNNEQKNQLTEEQRLLKLKRNQS